jgi:hypothetical protein
VKINLPSFLIFSALLGIESLAFVTGLDAEARWITAGIMLFQLPFLALIGVGEALKNRLQKQIEAGQARWCGNDFTEKLG